MTFNSYLTVSGTHKQRNSQTKAAKELNISEAALRYEMKEYGLSKHMY